MAFLVAGPMAAIWRCLKRSCRGDAEFAKTLPHRFDAVGAGENEPVVGLEILQSLVERLETIAACESR